MDDNPFFLRYFIVILYKGELRMLWKVINVFFYDNKHFDIC